MTTQTLPQTRNPSLAAFRAEAQPILEGFIDANGGDPDLSPEQKQALYDIAAKHGVDLAIESE